MTRMSKVLFSAPEAQCLLAPRFAGVPKKRSLFLGVEEWGTLDPKIDSRVP
jgi:hypothetical protein